MWICSFDGTKLKLQSNCRNVCPWIRKFCKHIVLPSFWIRMFGVSSLPTHLPHTHTHTHTHFDLYFILWQEKQGFAFDLAQAPKCLLSCSVVANYIATFGFKFSSFRFLLWIRVSWSKKPSKHLKIKRTSEVVSQMASIVNALPTVMSNVVTIRIQHEISRILTSFHLSCIPVIFWPPWYLSSFGKIPQIGSISSFWWCYWHLKEPIVDSVVKCTITKLPPLSYEGLALDIN